MNSLDANSFSDLLNAFSYFKLTDKGDIDVKTPLKALLSFLRDGGHPVPELEYDNTLLLRPTGSLSGDLEIIKNVTSSRVEYFRARFWVSIPLANFHQRAVWHEVVLTISLDRPDEYSVRVHTAPLTAQ